MAFESLKQNNQAVDGMIDRYEERMKKGLLEKKETEKNFEIVERALKSIKTKIKDPNFFDNLSREEIADLSNAWKAWSNEKFFSQTERKELAGMLIENTGNKKTERSLKYARQIWRTEVTNALIEHFQIDTKKADGEKATLMELIMASQIVKKGEASPREALMVAMHLDNGALKSKSLRDTLAKEMESSPIDHLNAWSGVNKIIQGKQVANFRVVVGGDLVFVPLKLRENLILKNVIIKENRIYAQMENGCKGNLVIIDVEPAPKPIPPEPIIPNETGELNDRFIRVDNKMGSLTPSAEQFDETTDIQLVSDELLRDYTTLGIEPFLAGLDSLSPSRQQAALNSIFNTLGESNPILARNLLNQIMQNTSDVMYQNVMNEFDTLANDPSNNPSTKAFWELQKALFSGQHESGDPTQMKTLFEKIDSIQTADLTPDLNDMLESNKKTIEFFVKRPLALDMVQTSISMAKETFAEGDRDDLEELRTKSKPELAEMLNNKGLSNWLDSDEEVYYSSLHVLEALRLALTYTYPADQVSGVKIDNPVQYYYEKIKDGSLSIITIPAGSAENVEDPLGAGQSFANGGTINLSSLFVDRPQEIRLFEKYQSGSESFGDHSIWNGYEGANAAFMGEGLDGKNGKGIIKGSESIFDNLFEKNGKPGGVDVLYINKIRSLVAMGNYDEARSLCVQVLKSELDKEKVVTDQEIKDRADKLSENWKTKIEAQVKLQLQAQGINNSTNVSNIPRVELIGQPGGAIGAYSNLDQYIGDQARQAIENKAYMELEGEVGQKLFEKNFTASSKLENAAFKQLADINGYGKIDWKAENADLGIDIGKTVAEIVVIELATAGMGSFASGALGAARVAGIGERAFAAGRVSGAVDRAYTWGQRSRNAMRLGTPGRLATGTSNVLSANSRMSAVGRNTLHATTFVELQHAMHGELFNPFNKEGAFEIGATAVTIYGLGKVQQFMRGQTLGAQRITGGAATKWYNPVDQLGKLSHLANRPNAALRTRGMLGGTGANAMEIPVEVVAMHYLGQAQGWTAEQVGLMSKTEREAMHEPEAWKEWAHSAGVIMGLRTWGGLREKTTDYYASLAPRAIMDSILRNGLGPDPYIENKIVKKDGKPFTPEERKILDSLSPIEKVLVEEYFESNGYSGLGSSEVILKEMKSKGIELGEYKLVENSYTGGDILRKDGNPISDAEKKVIETLNPAERTFVNKYLRSEPFRSVIKPEKIIESLKSKGLDIFNYNVIVSSGKILFVRKDGSPLAESESKILEGYVEALTPKEREAFIFFFRDRSSYGNVDPIIELINRLRSKGLDLDTYKFNREAGTIFLDKNGFPVKRSVASERDAIKKYLDKLPQAERERLEKYSRDVAPMKAECRVSINIPAYKEGEIIYNTLKEYTKQTDAEGRPLDPNTYEINVVVNREAHSTPDNTVLEVQRFKNENPQFNVNVIDVVFPTGSGGVGAARKLITDLTIHRSLARTNQEKSLYIETEDADLVHVDPKVVTNIVEKMDAKPYLDAVHGVEDRDPAVLMQNDTFFLYRRAAEIMGYLLRKESYRPHNRENANFVWNRVVTGGWNTAYSAEVYAKIGGYRPELKVGEDMYIGHAISLLRAPEVKGNYIPETRTVETVPTRIDSSPRRFLMSFITGKSPYSEFGNDKIEAEVRSKTDAELIEAMKPWATIDMTNKGKLEGEFQWHYDFIKGGTPSEAEALKVFDRMMFFLGFKKGDYVRNVKDGQFTIELTNLENVKQSLANYRANPRYLIKRKKQDELGEKEGTTVEKKRNFKDT